MLMALQWKKPRDPNTVFNPPQHQLLSQRAILASINDDAQKTKRIIHAWTDGACMNNGKRNSYGGWACLLRMTKPDGSVHEREWSGGEKPTTNNRMEMMAIIMALRKLKHPSKIVIHTDSKYVRNSICMWIGSWLRNGWTTKEGTPVKNRDLWKQMLSLLDRHTVAFVWTKGHASDKYNNRVDELAKMERNKLAPAA